NLLGTQITLNPAFRFIAEILDTQVHYTGLGSNTDKIGFLITSAVGALADNAKNIIKVDDVGFIGQDYAIDLSEVDVNNLRLSLGDNSFQSIGIKAVKPPLSGNYNELPFSNHVMQVPSVDVVVDTLKHMITLTEGVGGNTINTYQANELSSVIHNNCIDILQANTDKIQLRDLTFGNIYINGVVAGNSLNSANDTLNAAFNMDLVEYKEFLVSEVGINGDESEGGTLPVQANAWYYSYGTDAGGSAGSPNVSLYTAQRMPFYNGNALEQGHEFIFTPDSIGGFILGKWSGAEVATNHAAAFYDINWEFALYFRTASMRIRTLAGTDFASRWSENYPFTNSSLIAIRYGTDKHIYFIDRTGGADIVIAKTNIPQTTETFMLQFAGHYSSTFTNSAKLPIMQEQTQTWEIVHDFDNSESGEWADGIEDGTIIKSRMTLSPGQKITMDMNHFGRGEHIGFDYVGASSGVANAENQIDDHFFYNQSELLKGNADNGGSWTFNTDSDGYYNPNGDGSNVGYWNGNGVNLGAISIKYTDSNAVKLFHEDNNELIATLNIAKDGSPFHIYFGAAENNHEANRIPTLSKFDLADDSDPADSISEWWYIESPDGTFFYPLFKTEAEANAIDIKEGGSGTSHTHT
ncbi:MAG: hypothetical protein P8P29_03900, partial [Flavobacteriaceae bacterium]|nr:hypothetical protein [Flavobacteriaceae bacterium]